MFLGIDIHKREAQVAVRNDDGDVIEQVRVVVIRTTFASRGIGRSTLLRSSRAQSIARIDR